MLVTDLLALVLHLLAHRAVCIPLLPRPKAGVLFAEIQPPWRMCSQNIWHRVYLTLSYLKYIILSCWSAADSEGSGRFWISRIWDMNPFPWGCRQFSGLHQNLCELGLEPFWLLLPSSDGQYWSGRGKTIIGCTLEMYSLSVSWYWQ